MIENETTKLTALIRQLFHTCADLEAMFPGRPFTPDGHPMGSIGEVMAAARFGLHLDPPSNKGRDAHAEDGRAVEVKATSGKQAGSTRSGLQRGSRRGPCPPRPRDRRWRNARGVQRPRVGAAPSPQPTTQERSADDLAGEAAQAAAVGGAGRPADPRSLSPPGQTAVSLNRIAETTRLLTLKLTSGCTVGFW